MKRTILRTLALAMAMACVLTLFSGVTASAEKPMKSIKGITWNLKAKKTYSLPVKFAGVGVIERKAEITKYSVEQISETEKTAYITVVVDNPKSISKSQVHNIINSDAFKKTGKVSSGYYYAVVDYNTGACLEADNSFGVTVKSQTKYSNKKTYKDSDGCYIWTQKTTFVIEITYPASYKGLCFGIGAMKKDIASGKVNSFFEGKITFDKATDLYDKKHPDIAHFMRIK